MTAATDAGEWESQRLHSRGWVVAAAVFAWLAATAWARPLMLPDEGRYVGVALEMLRSGDWLTPTLDGLPYFHKPPLFYWITATSMSVFGANAWAARAAPLLGACLAALSLHAFARRWTPAGEARVGLRVLLVQPLFFLGAQFANLDMLVAGCISATVLLLADAALSAEHGRQHHGTREAAYVMAALGVLAKGLIGAVLPGLIVALWLLLRRRGAVLRALISWRGVLLFTAIACPWFVAMQLRFNGFLDYFFVVQHFKRFAAGGFNNVQPFWFYPAVLAAGAAPFLPWLRAATARGYFQHPSRSPVRLLMAVWLVVVVGFFSLPASKLIGYVLPAVPPLAWLIADSFLARPAPSVRSRQLWHASFAVAAVLGLGIVAWFSWQPRHSTRELAQIIAARRAPDEPVFMLNHYDFDVPFYAHLQAPVRVVDDWSGDEVQRQDNWRRELADAGRFAPAAARLSLLEKRDLASALRQAPVNWVLGPADAALTWPLLLHAQPVATVRGTTLWRVVTDAR
ncbi:ArnT family glycosyltransferase [Roseateles sp. BYS78W]|uniref:ArnT family glycosyltransferase n=1 Tax=Pelomonas candidula TaxID=3299025 RepID=A0ABW7H8H9_9BURK